MINRGSIEGAKQARLKTLPTWIGTRRMEETAYCGVDRLSRLGSGVLVFKTNRCGVGVSIQPFQRAKGFNGGTGFG